jgi:hypothetical protein
VLNPSYALVFSAHTERRFAIFATSLKPLTLGCEQYCSVNADWVGHNGGITARHRQPSVTESSVTLPPQYRESTVSSTEQFLTAIERPRCPRCQMRMMLERVSSGPIGFEHRLFECPRCDHVEISIIPSDPFKSNAAGWLTEELRVPN